VRQIDLDQIRPNRDQPRKNFDEAALEELAESLKSQGVIQPVIVRPAENGQYELIVGERRWRAAQRAGLLKIPALIRDTGDKEMLELALIENIQREELNPLETALAFQSLIDDLGLTQQQVADRVGKQRSTVANLLRVLVLHPKVQERVRTGELSLGHAKVLASVSSPRLQIDLAERIVRGAISVRQAEGLTKRVQGGEVSEATPRSQPPRDPNVVAAEEALQRALATKVRILQNEKGRGRIEIHFHSGEELQRVYEAVLPSARGH
jgi:ParB family chromosome partitioning protein